MSGRALSVALLARRFGLLADRIELMRPERQERVDAMLRDAGCALNALDVELVAGAGPLDFLCGYALRRLRSSGREQRGVLDVLGVLPPDWLLGIVYALPEDRREAVRAADGTWTYRAAEVEREMPAALAEVRRLGIVCEDAEQATAVAELSPGEQQQHEEFNRATLGLPATLPPELRELLNGPHAERMDALLEEEIREAIRRAADRCRAETGGARGL